MRKWMRERIQRRKKDSPGEEKNEAAAPLQPAYFDAPSATVAEPAAVAKTAENCSQHTRVDARGSRQRAVAGNITDEGLAEGGSEDVGTGNEADGEAAPDVSPIGTVAVGAEAPGSQAPATGDPRARRRRRGRGGRGRSAGQRGRAQAVNPDAKGTTEHGASASTAPAAREASAAPISLETPAPRASKGAVILAIGLPGSGKSSWFKRHNISPLSSDMLRAILFDDAGEQRFQDLIFSNLRSMLKARLIARRPLNYVDATNLTPHERASWIKLGKDYGYDVQAVFFDVPLEVCLHRNQKRERVVAEDVMRRMAAKLKAPGFEEGFSKITVVRVKQKE